MFRTRKVIAEIFSIVGVIRQQCTLDLFFGGGGRRPIIFVNDEFGGSDLYRRFILPAIQTWVQELCCAKDLRIPCALIDG